MMPFPLPVFLTIESAGFHLFPTISNAGGEPRKNGLARKLASGMFMRMMLPNRYFSVSLSPRNKEASESNGEEKK